MKLHKVYDKKKEKIVKHCRRLPSYLINNHLIKFWASQTLWLFWAKQNKKAYMVKDMSSKLQLHRKKQKLKPIILHLFLLLPETFL